MSRQKTNFLNPSYFKNINNGMLIQKMMKEFLAVNFVKFNGREYIIYTDTEVMVIKESKNNFFVFGEFGRSLLNNDKSLNEIYQFLYPKQDEEFWVFFEELKFTLASMKKVKTSYVELEKYPVVDLYLWRLGDNCFLYSFLGDFDQIDSKPQIGTADQLKNAISHVFEFQI